MENKHFVGERLEYVGITGVVSHQNKDTWGLSSNNHHQDHHHHHHHHHQHHHQQQYHRIQTSNTWDLNDLVPNLAIQVRNGTVTVVKRKRSLNLWCSSCHAWLPDGTPPKTNYETQNLQFRVGSTDVHKDLWRKSVSMQKQNLWPVSMTFPVLSHSYLFFSSPFVSELYGSRSNHWGFLGSDEDWRKEFELLRQECTWAELLKQC